MRTAIIALLALAGCASVPRDDPVLAAATATVCIENARGHASAIPVEAVPRPGGGWRVRLLTAAHIMPHGPFVVDGNRVVSITQFMDRDIAVAVVYMDDAPTLAPLSARVPLTGETLLVAGYPMYGGVLRISGGFAASKAGHMSAPLAPGISGGPVIDRTGAVVGICTQIDQYGPSLIWHVSQYEPVDKVLLWWLGTAAGQKAGAAR